MDWNLKFKNWKKRKLNLKEKKYVESSYP